jgi:hypothetical protein
VPPEQYKVLRPESNGGAGYPVSELVEDLGREPRPAVLNEQGV